MKKIYCSVLAVLLVSCLSFGAFGAGVDDFTALTDMYGSNGTVKLKLGEQENLSSMMIHYDTENEITPVGSRTWSSRDPDIATVDANGVVTAKKLGTAKIFVIYSDNMADNITQTVRVKVISGVKAESPDNYLTVEEGLELNLMALLYPDFSADSGETVQWSVQKKFVASVNAKGIVFAKSYGTTKITVTHTDAAGNDTTEDLTLKVVGRNHNVLGRYNITLAPDEQVDIIKVLYPNSSGASKYITCSSSDSAVVTVGSGNTLKAKRAGECTVTVVYGAGMDDEQRRTVKVVVE